jgi:hypothetical protein
MRDGCLNHCLNAVVIAHVQPEEKRFAAKRFDFGLERFQRVWIAAGYDEIGALSRQRTGKVLTKTAAGARYQGYLISKIKQGVRHSGSEYSSIKHQTSGNIQASKLKSAELMLQVLNFPES